VSLFKLGSGYKMSNAQYSPSVVIPVDDDRLNLINILKALEKQSFKNLEIIIVESGDFDKTKIVVERFKKKLNISLYRQKGRGLTEARNEAFYRAKGNIVVFVDADVKPTSKWLKELVASFEADSKVGGVGGPSLMPKTIMNRRDLTEYLVSQRALSITKRIIRNIFFKIFLEGDPYSINKFFKSGAYSVGSMIPEIIERLPSPVKVDFLDASNMAFKANLMKEIGGFDTGFKGLGEYSEPDVCFKIKSKGYSLVFNAKAVVYHYPSYAQTHSSKSHAYNRGRNFSRFLKRYFIHRLTVEAFVYALFFNFYHAYKALKDRDPTWFYCVKGFIVGLEGR